MVKRIFSLLLLFLGAHLVEKFCHKETDGFTILRIQGCPSSSPSPETYQILHQKFFYFICGNQCYTFLSEDGKYILKLFKYAENVPLWTAKVPILNRFKAFRPSKVRYRSWKKERDTEAYTIAYEEWREETALVATHLAP